MNARTSTKDFLLLIFVTACLFISRYMYLPIFTLFLKERNFSTLQIGSLVSTRSLSTILSRFAISPLSEKIRSGWFILFSLIGQPIVFILFAFARENSWFYPIQVLSAVTGALIIPLGMSLVLKIAPPERRGDAVGRYLTSYGISTLVGPLISGILLAYFQISYQAIFLTAIIPSLIGLLLFGSLIKTGSTYFFNNEPSIEKRAYESTAFIKNLKTIFTNTNVIVLSITRFGFAFTSAFFQTLFPLYAVDELDISPALVSVLFTIYGLFNTVTRIPSGRLSDIVGRKKPLSIAIFLLALVNFGLSIEKNHGVVIFLVVLYGACHGIRAVTEFTFLGDSVPQELRGVANSYFENIFDIGATLGAFISGILASPIVGLPISGVYQTASIIMLIIGILLAYKAQTS